MGHRSALNLVLSTYTMLNAVQQSLVLAMQTLPGDVHLLLVLLELWALGVLEGHSQSGNLVVVGATLQGGEYCGVDAVLIVEGAVLWLTLLQHIRRLDTLHGR